MAAFATKGRRGHVSRFLIPSPTGRPAFIRALRLLSWSIVKSSVRGAKWPRFYSVLWREGHSLKDMNYAWSEILCRE
jgi:hypothetical protein